MNYQETTEYLFNSTPVFEKIGAKAYKPGLQTTFALDEHFGHPHQKYKTIHIAGTNGKGSSSHTLAAILQSQGYKVGLYTSPHLVDFRERIRVNGECVPEQYVIDFVEENRAFFEPLHPSFFELTTAMALKYFAEQEVDYAVIEVGLGGRLDCTNIITPILSIITNISFDHTQFLGNTLVEIAGEKAGIIKPDIPVVIGEYLPETRPVFEKKAKAENAPILFAQDFDATHLENSVTCDVDMELKGSYQERNNMDTYQFSYGGSTNIYLPWNMSLSTDLSQSSRRGYSDASMNRDELIWNAQLSQNFLKGNAATISVQLYDILKNQSNVSRTISAAMRQDTEYNAIYSYCMVHFIYRLNLFGGKQARRDGGFGGPGGPGGYGGIFLNKVVLLRTIRTFTPTVTNAHIDRYERSHRSM